MIKNKKQGIVIITVTDKIIDIIITKIIRR